MIFCTYCDTRIGGNQRYDDGYDDGYVCSGCRVFVSKKRLFANYENVSE